MGTSLKHLDKFLITNQPKFSNFVYCLSEIDGPVRYVGRTSRGLTRFNSHYNECFSKNMPNTRKNNWLKKLFLSGEKIEVVILEEHENFNETLESERFYISYFKFLGFDLTNLTEGGEGVLGFKLSKESLEKMASKLRDRVGANKGIKFSDEIRKKLSEAHKGIPASETQKQKQSEKMKELTPFAKIQKEQIKEIRKLLEQGNTHRYIAQIYGVCRSTITAINNGKTWSYVS